MPVTNILDEPLGSAAAFPRLLYHAAPLHYLPSILQLSILLAASLGRERKILPRRSATRRDRMLGLDSYVHLALDPLTPLVRDKLAKGMPHVLLEFDGHLVFEHCQCSALPYNTKAWKTKHCMQPISHYQKIRDLFRHHVEFGRYPSMEVLVPTKLSLDFCTSIHVFSDCDRILVEDLMRPLRKENRLMVTGSRPDVTYSGCSASATRDYVLECIRSADALPVPIGIEFD